MNKQIIPYEEAIAIRELGFNEPCFCIYNREKALRFNNLNNPDDRNKSVKLLNNNGKNPAPTWQQIFDWFEEKYHLYINILGDGFNGKLKGFYYSITEEGWINYYESIDDNKWYNNKKEARLACLKKLIELCKKKIT